MFGTFLHFESVSCLNALNNSQQQLSLSTTARSDHVIHAWPRPCIWTLPWQRKSPDANHVHERKSKLHKKGRYSRLHAVQKKQGTCMFSSLLQYTFRVVLVVACLCFLETLTTSMSWLAFWRGGQPAEQIDVYRNITENQWPIVYSSSYNIGFMRMERLHPFDSGKWGRVFGMLRGMLALCNVATLACSKWLKV